MTPIYDSCIEWDTVLMTYQKMLEQIFFLKIVTC